MYMYKDTTKIQVHRNFFSLLVLSLPPSPPPLSSPTPTLGGDHPTQSIRVILRW